MKQLIYQIRIKTPLGDLLAIASQRGLCGLEFDADERFAASVWRVSTQYPAHQRIVCENDHLTATKVWLQNYFSTDFITLLLPPSLDLIGSEFDKKIWMALLHIPAGKLATYGQLAESVGCQGAARAVGAAVGRNPVGIIVPCHRIIGKNRTLTGYGGGLNRKQWLLNHEGFDVRGKTPTSRVTHSDAMAFAGLS